MFTWIYGFLILLFQTSLNCLVGAIDTMTPTEYSTASGIGEAKGEDKLSCLISHLLALEKTDEILSATKNAVLRNQLYEKYNIN